MNARLNAILELARRYDYEPGHAHQVECLAGTLFMELEMLHGLRREDRKLLEYAAILHDIGYYISTKGHHRHALQMIMMEPLPEFRREEKYVIANIARYHRKALPVMDHTAFGILAEEDKHRVTLLAPLLRVADALDRSHMGHIQELSCDVSADTVTINIGADAGLIAEEKAIDNKADMFRQIYGKEVRLQVQAPRLVDADLTEAYTAFEKVN